jgi:hypothetical protein
MQRNIPKPDNVITLLKTEHIEFFRVEQPPQEWKFDENGNWIGYGE